ncbi:MAG: DUF4173 domain-containing protein [Phycisphaeraceae bacterium]|nr:DUF4173 domain-containing protein [Phycisphaeraceae bacterium]
METVNPVLPLPGPYKPSIPKPPQPIVRWVLGVSLCLGVACDCLLRGGPWGFNVTCFAGLLSLVIAWGWHRHTEHAPCWTLLLLLFFFSMGVAWRENLALTSLNLGTMGILLLILNARPTRSNLNSAPLYTLMVNSKYALGRIIAAPIRLLGYDMDWSQSIPRLRCAPSKSVLRALLLTAPLLVVFTWLFASADAIFNHALESMGTLVNQLIDQSQTCLTHTLWSLLFGLLIIMILHPVALGKRWKPAVATPPATFAVGQLETATVLGTLLLLFLCFIGIQLRYLFGGTDLVQNVAGLTYADYARHGFFALLKVVLLLHIVLMAGGWLVKESDEATQRLFARLSLGLIALTIFIFVSAFFRLSLYVGAYGLTRARLYAASVLVWLALVFMLMALKLMRPNWNNFTGAYLYAFMGVLALLNISNPDGVITRVNLDRYVAGKTLDWGYMTSLSQDAIPTLLQYEGTLTKADMTTMVEEFRSHHTFEAPQSWRGWHYGRSRARRLINRFSDTPP